MKDKVIFHTKWLNAIETLTSDHDKIALYHAVFKYILKGEMLPLTDKQQAIFDVLGIRKSPKPKVVSINLEKPLEERKKDFENELKQYVPKFGKDMVFAFFDYWSEPNKSGTRMKFETKDTWCLAGRLRTWERNSYGR